MGKFSIVKLLNPVQIVNGVQNNYNALSDPTSAQDQSQGYSVGSIWINTACDSVFLNVDNTNCAAIWKHFATLTDCQTLTNKTLTSPVLNCTVTGTAIDTCLCVVSCCHNTLASAKAIKTYVDCTVTAQDLDLVGDNCCAPISIDLDSETLAINGGTGINSTGCATCNKVTLSIDCTVATLAGQGFACLTDNAILRANGCNALQDTGITITDGCIITHSKEGDQSIYSQDPSVFRSGSWSQTASGGLYCLVCDLVMYYQSHNAPIDACGNFGCRDEACEHSQLFVWTEGGRQVYYNSTNLTGVPCWDKRWEFNLVNGFLNSGSNTFNLQSEVTDCACSKAFVANSTNQLTANGSRILSIQNNCCPLFYVGVDNCSEGVWSYKAAFGCSASIDTHSLLNLDGTVCIDSGFVDGTGVVCICSTMNMTAAIKQAAAFSGKTTVTGSAAFPFISGMLFQVNNNGTGSWVANPGNWGLHPTIIAGRWTSEAGSASLGSWGNTFFSGTPNFNASGGSFSSGTFNHFEAGRITASDSSFFNNANGMYIRVQSATTNAYGIYIEPGISGGTDSAGIVLHEDNDGGSILLGAGKDARIYYDGCDLVFNSQVVGCGDFKFLSGDISVVNGTVCSPAIKFTCDPDSGIYRKGANNYAFTANGVEGLSIKGDTNDAKVIVGKESISTCSNTKFVITSCNTSKTADASIGFYNQIGNENWTLGSDVTDCNKFKLSKAKALGTNDIIEVCYCTEDVTVNTALRTNAVYVNTSTITCVCYTVQASDYNLAFDASCNNICVTLPTANADSGRKLRLCRVDNGSSGNTVTINRAGSDTIGTSCTSINLLSNEVLDLIAVTSSIWM